MFQSVSVRVGVLLSCLLFSPTSGSKNTGALANMGLDQAGSSAILHVTTSRNDAQAVNKVMYLSSRVLPLRAATTVGVRFKKVDTPRAAVAKPAYIKSKVGPPKRGKLGLDVRDPDSRSSRPFAVVESDLGSRGSLSALSVWALRAWTVSQTLRIPELSTNLREIAGQSDWNSGNVTAFMMARHSSAQRAAVIYDRNRSDLPVLAVPFHNLEIRTNRDSPIQGNRVVIRTPLQIGVPQLLIGQGPVGADRLREAELITKGGLRMLTTWFNSSTDLDWQREYKATFVPAAYEKGYALHLIVFSDDPEKEFETAYGTACGRPYPLSPRFLRDLRQLAEVWAGTAASPPLYFTLFTEFQTYPCRDNAWRPNQQVNNYYKALKDVYRQAQKIIYEAAPNAVVSLGWGGWQSFEGDREIGEGKAMIPFFADLMNDSDFVSVQAMDSRGRNPADIQRMVAAINREAPGKPIMVAHYKPDDKNHQTFRSDLKHILSDAYISWLNHRGVFAFSFMDDENQKVDPAFYERFIVPKVRRYSKAP